MASKEPGLGKASEGDVGSTSRPAGLKSSWTASLLLVTCLASLGSFNFGYNISVINTPAGTFARCPAGSSAWQCFPVSESAWGLVVSIMGIGALVGSLATGPVANRLGRRLTLILMNLPYVLGFLLESLSVRYWMLVLGRFFVGLGVGAACIVTPLYLSEIGSVDIRGQVTATHQLAICVGIVAVEMLGFCGLSGPGKWRVMFALGLVPAVGQMLGMAWYGTESPRFLAQLGNAQGTRAALKRLRQEGFREEECEWMLESAQDSPSQAADTWSFLRLLQSLPLAGRSLAVAMMLHVAQQFSGINVVFYFSSRMFADGPGASTIPAVISILNLFATLLAMWLVERAGRRALCLGSTAGIVVTLSAFIAFYLVHWPLASVVCILAYVASFAVGMGPIPWLMMNELFPTQAAGAAVSLAVALNWTCNSLVGASFGWMRARLGEWALAPYAAFSAVFFVYAWFRVPETKGRPIGFV